MDKKPFNIFVSHIHEEKDIAFVLQKRFHACFPGYVKIFVSSAYENIPLGRKWLHEIDSAMDIAVDC